MVPKGYKKPEVWEITEEKGIFQYVPWENIIEISREFNELDTYSWGLRHEIVHSLQFQRHATKQISIFQLFLFEIGAYFNMVPKYNRNWKFFSVWIPLVPFLALGSVIKAFYAKR